MNKLNIVERNGMSIATGEGRERERRAQELGREKTGITSARDCRNGAGVTFGLVQ